MTESVPSESEAAAVIPTRVPLAALSPDVRDPVGRKTAREMLQLLKRKQSGMKTVRLVEECESHGAKVIVTEVDPLRSLEAAMDGYRVMPLMDAAGSLAGGAVVRFRIGVPDSLDWSATVGAGFARAPMDRHLLAEGGDLCREAIPNLLPKTLGPLIEHRHRGLEKPRYFTIRQAVRTSKRREPRAVEDLVGVGVADSAQDPRVGEGSFEGVALVCDCRTEVVEISVKHLETTRIVLRQGILSLDQMEGRPALRSRLGENKRAGREIKRSQRAATGRLGSFGSPP